MTATILEDLMAGIGGGWSGIDDAQDVAQRINERQQAADIEQAQAEAAIVKRALDTPDGHEFLRWLAGKTVMRRPNAVEMSAQTADAYAIAKAKREGQNQTFFMISDALDYGRDIDKAETDQ